MIHFKTNKGSFIAVPVPDGMIEVISQDGFIYATYPYENNDTTAKTFAASIPYNSKLIGRVKDLTEEQWREIVDSWDSVWNDGTIIYENYKDGGTIPKCRTALKSGLSLCTAHGIQQHDVVVRVG